MQKRSVALAIALAIVSVGCAGSGSGQTSVSSLDPGVLHVHSLDVDPADGGLYAATHTGLFKVSQYGTAERVGERWHDLMGCTLAGPGDLVASGHPDLRDPELSRPDVRPLLGLVASEDGVDWRPLSLFGEVGFHLLSATHGRIYGWDATSNRLMVSKDLGPGRPARIDLSVISLSAPTIPKSSSESASRASREVS